jgi:hypothetical protein
MKVVIGFVPARRALSTRRCELVIDSGMAIWLFECVAAPMLRPRATIATRQILKELKTAVHIYNSRCHRKILSSEHLACSFDYSGAI